MPSSELLGHFQINLLVKLYGFAANCQLHRMQKALEPLNTEVNCKTSAIYHQFRVPNCKCSFETNYAEKLYVLITFCSFAVYIRVVGTEIKVNK